MTEKNNWHSVSYDEIVKDFGSNTELGLHPDEIEVFQAKYGKNILTPKKTDGPIKRFLLQFNQPLLYILIIAGFVTFFLKNLRILPLFSELL